MEKQLNEYRNYLVEEINMLDEYNNYLDENHKDLVTFLKIVNFKEGANLYRIKIIVDSLIALSENRASLMDEVATFLNENSKTLTFKDVKDKTIIYNRALKIKNIEYGSTKA